ncbi:ABC transporter permease subunit [Candidatus Latescibacterota bacterium]
MTGILLLKTIIIREIQDQIKSRKFLIGLCLTIFLVVLTNVLNTRDYIRRKQVYLDAKSNLQQDLDLQEITIYRIPEILSIFVQGKEKRLGNRANIGARSIPVETFGYLGNRFSRYKQTNAGYAPIDFAFVIKVIFSLFVIFITYDSVSGEKSQGTLKLVFSNSISRYKFLLSKFFSGLIVIGSSLIIALLISILIMIFHPNISFSTSDWIRIFGIIFVSFIYLTAIYMICLFISVMVNRSSISLLILLNIWIYFVTVAPNLGVVIAEKWYPIQTKTEMELQEKEIADPYLKKGNNIRADGDSLGYIEMHTKFREASYNIRRNYINTLIQQANFAEAISLFSPAVLFDLIVMRLARTGLEEYERFLDGIYRYAVNNYEIQFRLKEIDYSKLSDFSYYSENTIESFYALLPYFLILLFYSILFFILALTSFIRKDVI